MTKRHAKRVVVKRRVIRVAKVAKVANRFARTKKKVKLELMVSTNELAKLTKRLGKTAPLLIRWAVQKKFPQLLA